LAVEKYEREEKAPVSTLQLDHKRDPSICVCVRVLGRCFLYPRVLKDFVRQLPFFRKTRIKYISPAHRLFYIDRKKGFLPGRSLCALFVNNTKGRNIFNPFK